MKRHLSLRKETLTRLDPDDLGRVHGAAADGTHVTCYTGLTYCVCDELINDTFLCLTGPTIPA